MHSVLKTVNKRLKEKEHTKNLFFYIPLKLNPGEIVYCLFA